MSSLLMPGEPLAPTRAVGRAAKRVFAVGLVALLAAGTPALAADAGTVTGAQVAVVDDVTAVALQISTDGSAPVVSPFRQSNPERLVLDIAGARLAAGATVTGGGMVKSGEFSSFNDGQDNVRLTLYLSGAASFDVKADAGSVIVTLRAGASADPLGSALGQAPSGGSSASGVPTGLDNVGGVKLSGPDVPVGGPSLTTLDFEQRERVSRVLIGTQSSEPAITQPERGLIAVDLPGAFIPESLRREIDTRFFYSAVDSVRAYPTRAGGRIAIRLREGAEYSVKRENGLTVLEVSIPSSIVAARDAAVQRSSEAAPSEPKSNGSGGGLSNASGSEVLISNSGRSMDPQAVYGSGSGTTSASKYAFTTDTGTATSGRYTGRRMSIDLQEADIHTVFRFIADFGDVNIVTSDDVKGNVTVRLKDVPWDEAMAAILQAKSLGAQQMGRVIRVAPLETIKSEQVAALEAKKSAEQLEDLQLYVAPLNYATARDVQGQIASVLSDRGKIEVDTRGNQLIIRDRADEIAQARELIRTVDRPNRQVSIEARFVEATSTKSTSFGIQWGGDLDASSSTGYPTGAVFPNSIGATGGLPMPVGSTTGAGGGRGPVFYAPDAQSLLVDLGANAPTSAVSFALGSISGLIDIDARLSAAVNEGWGKIISSPRVSALDNEEAVVSQGARIPYLSTSQNGTQVQFVEANLELRVTPHITADSTIFLDISITNDRPDFSLSGAAQGQPGVSTKSVETKILVPDGDTAVLGGVYSTSESYSTSRVPGLGDIPVLGYLFKNSSTTRDQNEMLVFITPRIVPIEAQSSRN